MAKKRWIGAAVAVAQKTTVTVGGTWATAETATLISGNGNRLTVTVGASTTTEDVAELLAAAFNAIDANDELVDDESRNLGGQEIAEFAEIEAVAIGATVVLTGSVAGSPFEVTAAETSTSGTLSVVETTSATGPHHADNVDNWSTHSLPADDDEVVFDFGDVDLLYGLDQSAVTPAAIVRTQNYTGRIGLPATNESNASQPYPEYRQRFLQFGNADAETTTAITIGQGDGAGGGMNLDSGDGQIVLNVFATGSTASDDAFRWKGTHAANVVNVHRGNVQIAPDMDELATVATLRIGYIENQSGDAAVDCGVGVTLTAVEMTGGSATVRSDTTTFAIEAGVAELLAGDHADLNLRGGEAFYRSTGELTSVHVSGGGRLDFSRDNRSRTVANCTLHRDGEIRDPFRSAVFSNGVDLHRTDLAGVALQLGSHLTLTVSDI
ncbi:MAG: hypothetical protein NXI22_15055 [bacterium]|nr:hypothetical protein [bacterium]